MNLFKRLRLLKSDLRKSYDWYYITLPLIYNPNDSLHWKMKHREMTRDTLITIEKQKTLICECQKEILIYKKTLTLIIL